jgi:hypothetical protein
MAKNIFPYINRPKSNNRVEEEDREGMLKNNESREKANIFTTKLWISQMVVV